jgi:nucleotide-binding universal stress UspA family protein
MTGAQTGEGTRDHTIVVGVDHTESAQDAVVWAAHEAQRRRAALTLVLAFERPIFAALSDGADLVDPRVRAAGLLTESSELAQQVAPNLRIRTRLLDGWPIAVLSKESAGADMLVVGSHGAGQLSVAVLGSTARALSTTGTAPLVVIRGTVPESLPEEADTLPVFVGIDGSRQSRRAAELAAEESSVAAASLIVVHVDTGAGTDGDAMTMVKALVAAYPECDLSYRRLHRPVVDALVDCSTAAHMLVVGSRGRGGIAGLFGGSVSQALMRQVQCPLAVVPPTMSPTARRGSGDET